MKVIELFCGSGGLAFGLKKAGFEHSLLIDNDYWSIETIALNNWSEGAFADVRAFDFCKFEGQIDLIAGGPPCQPFSVSGIGQMSQDPRNMFPDAVRVIGEVVPKAFLLENVSGFLRSANSEYLRYLLLQLASPNSRKYEAESEDSHRARLLNQQMDSFNLNEKYHVQIFDVNAANYGVPQTRRRIFIVGTRMDRSSRFVLPAPTHSKAALLFDQLVSQKYWFRHNIAAPQPLKKDQNELIRMIDNVEQLKLKPWVTVRDVFASIPCPADTLSAVVLPGHYLIRGAKRYKKHTPSSLDLPAKTLMAGVHGVGGGKNTVVLDNGDIRYFSLFEAQLIQSFPRSYKFAGARSHIVRQLGNAVPSRLAEVFGRNLAKCIRAN